jgi:hypothetical protein
MEIVLLGGKSLFMCPGWKLESERTYPKDRWNTYRMPKLTLSVDPVVVSRAKRYAKQNGLSLSKMVEAYLASVSAPLRRKICPRFFARSGESSRRATPRTIKKHLAEKYL